MSKKATATKATATKATATKATATAQSPLADLVAVLRPAIMAGVAKELAASFGVNLPGNGNGNEGNGNEGDGNGDAGNGGIVAATTRQKLVGQWYMAEVSADNLLSRAAKAYEKLEGTKELLQDCRAIKDDDGRQIYPDTRTPSGYIAALRKAAKEEGREFQNSEIPFWAIKFSRLFDKVRKRQQAYRESQGIESGHGNSGDNNAVHSRVTEKSVFSNWLKENPDNEIINGANVMFDCWGDWQAAANMLAEKANIKKPDIQARMKKAKEKSKKQ